MFHYISWDLVTKPTRFHEDGTLPFSLLIITCQVSESANVLLNLIARNSHNTPIKTALTIGILSFLIYIISKQPLK
jgi:hypothetical protein